MIFKGTLEIEICLSSSYLNKCHESAENAEKNGNEEEFKYWNGEALRTEIEKETLKYLYNKYFD